MQKGYLAISSILIISAAVLAVTISASYLSIGEGQVSLAQAKSESQLSLIESCLENTLLKLRSNPYSGGGGVLPEGTCNVIGSDQGNGNYIFYIYSTDVSYYRFIQVSVNRDYSITMTSWKEQ